MRVIDILAYPTNSQYRRFHLHGITLKEKAVLFTSENIATEQLFEKLRRDGTEVIRHPRALAIKAREIGLSINSIAIAWLHDVTEDGLDHLAPSVIGAMFDDPIDGQEIAFGVDALTHRDDESVLDYYERILKATAVNWQILVIKVLDRWHFHVCPYGGSVEKEMAKAFETLGPFREMCKQGRQYIPKDFLPIYDELVSEVMRLAEKRLSELKTQCS